MSSSGGIPPRSTISCRAASRRRSRLRLASARSSATPFTPLAEDFPPYIDTVRHTEEFPPLMPRRSRSMRIGLFVDELGMSLDAVVEKTREVAEAGFTGAWFAQRHGWDALTTLAIAG